MDPQGNASSGLGIDRQTFAEKNLYHVLIDDLSVQEAIYQTELKFLKICPSDNNLSGAEVELVGAMAREMRLKNAFESICKEGEELFDYVFIDCPPSLGLLTINALTASNYYMIPLQCEYYAMEGLGQFLHTTELIKKGLNKHLAQLGIVLTMFDSRNNLSRQVYSEVKSHFKDQVFETVIPRNVKLSECPSHGKPAILYDISSTGSQSYLALAQEVIARLEPKPEEVTQILETPVEKVEAAPILEASEAPSEAAPEEIPVEIAQTQPQQTDQGVEHGVN
jgi:chromosome partitioning protein